MSETANFCLACGQPAATPPSVSETPAGRTSASLPLGGYLKTGWELFDRYHGLFIGYIVVLFVIAFALGQIPYIGDLAYFTISNPLYIGLFIVTAKLLQKHPVQFSDFFLGFRFFVPLLLVSLALLLVCLICSLPVLLVGVLANFLIGQMAGMVLLILLVLLLICLASGFMFVSPLVIDRRLDRWKALKLTYETLSPRWLGAIGFLLLLFLINMAGAFCLVIGLLVTLPVSMCALTAAYADIFGLQSDYGEGFPDKVVSDKSPGV
jgi:hypothetical protein